MTDSNPTPFRRFPWAQLVFCLACLGMATWMLIKETSCLRGRLAELADSSHEWPFLGQYVSVEATPSFSDPGPLSPATPGGELHHFPFEDGRTIVYLKDFKDGYGYSICILLPPDAPMPSTKDIFTGRLVWVEGQIKRGGPFNGIAIDSSASRLFTGASIAGLVVGAMGCFIFGLYLRRWLREGKAAA